MPALRALLAAALLLPPVLAQAPAPRFANGPPEDGTFFPLGVWLQAPQNAARYRELGINLYVGLYEGPTATQLAALDAAGMPVICAQNDVGLACAGPTIVGWLQPDEPDNGQPRRTFGYGPPIPPADIAAAYERMHRADPTRPVLLNLGQGAAWDGWHGRGGRSGHAEDYAEYLKGCDIASFDIYPVTHTHRDVKGRLEFVGRGVQRLLAGSRGTKPVWACIETTHIDNRDVRPTPQQVQDEVWIAICSGAVGIVYFVHEFAPAFVEAGLLRHPEIADTVRWINERIQTLAPVLHAPRADAAVAVETDPKTALALRVHRHEGKLHLFVASLSPEPVTARFDVREKHWRDLHVDFPAHVGGKGWGRSFDCASFTIELRGYGFAHARLTP